MPDILLYLKIGGCCPQSTLRSYLNWVDSWGGHHHDIATVGPVTKKSVLSPGDLTPRMNRNAIHDKTPSIFTCYRYRRLSPRGTGYPDATCYPATTRDSSRYRVLSPEGLPQPCGMNLSEIIHYCAIFYRWKTISPSVFSCISQLWLGCYPAHRCRCRWLDRGLSRRMD